MVQHHLHKIIPYNAPKCIWGLWGFRHKKQSTIIYLII